MEARRLFHAVVVTGAALAAAPTACGSDSSTQTDPPGSPSDASSTSSGGDAASDGQGADAPVDGADPLDAADDADAACPPGSDHAFPPCNIIK